MVDRVTVDRNKLKMMGGSWYVLIPSRIADAVEIDADDIAAFDRDVLSDGELGRLTIRIEKFSELKQQPPRDAN